MDRPSFHEDLSRDEAGGTPSDRSFGFVFSMAFTVIGLMPLLWGRGARVWALELALLFLVLAVLFPMVLHPLNRVWMRLGQLLHMVVNPVAMGAIFFVVISPVALVMRLARRDVMKKKFDRSARTYWIPRDSPGTDPASMRNQF